MREPPKRGGSQNSENGFKKDSTPKNFFAIEIWRDERKSKNGDTIIKTVIKKN